MKRKLVYRGSDEVLQMLRMINDRGLLKRYYYERQQDIGLLKVLFKAYIFIPWEYHSNDHYMAAVHPS